MVLDHWFPFADDLGVAVGRGHTPLEEEEMLIDLLLAHAAAGEGRGPGVPDLPAILARVVARRAMRPDHLWQDLGLFDRSELTRLLVRHFPTLAAGNTANMKWKKYFYRKLCEAEGFVLCTAPSCARCNDFAVCFGAEDGESRMAAARREIDRAGTRIAAE
jgi:nitrogen fixation protein NifQ